MNTNDRKQLERSRRRFGGRVANIYSCFINATGNVSRKRRYRDDYICDTFVAMNCPNISNLDIYPNEIILEENVITRSNKTES